MTTTCQSWCTFRVEKGERKLRRSCAHPRAGASRHRARPVPVSDWPVVPSRAFRWRSSLLFSPSDISLFRRVPRRLLDHYLFHLLRSLRSDILYPIPSSSNSSIVTNRARHRLDENTAEGNLSGSGMLLATFPRARELNITRVNLFWREGVELLLDRVFPLLALPTLFPSPFLSKIASLSSVYTGFSYRFSAASPPCAIYRHRLDLFSQIDSCQRKANSRPGPSRTHSLPFTRS